MGGTVKTVDDGRARVNRLNELLALEDRAAASFEALMGGIETSRATLDRAFAIADAALAAGPRAVVSGLETYGRRRAVADARARQPRGNPSGGGPHLAVASAEKRGP